MSRWPEVDGLVIGPEPFRGGFATAVGPLLAPVLAGSGDLRLTTSGSTGRPRVVRRTAASWAASLPALDALTGLRAGQVVWTPGPASSTLTLYAAVHALAAGASVLASGPWRGVPDAIRASARDAAAVQAVPVVLDGILDALASDGSRGRPWALRVAVVAGGPARPGLRRRCVEHGIRLVEYYGSAELSFVAVDHDGTGLRPFPGVEVRLRDGVLWARSAYLAESVDGVPVRDADGWGTSGDRGSWTDESGTDGEGRRLRLLGRPGSAQVAGHTVHLAEVEAVLATAPGVGAVICLPIPDPQLGQRLLALIEAEDGADPLPAIRLAEAGLPAPSRPVRHQVVATLPRTPAGKVDRAALERSWATP